MTHRAQGSRWLVVFLWIAVITSGVAFGAKLFEFTVVISAWAADPPASLSLMPYGPGHPYDPGDFFLPLSILALIGWVGALVCARKALRSYRIWLWVALASFLVIWLATPTLFWPMIGDLYHAGTGARTLDASAAQSLVNRWLVLDWLRTAFIAVGLVCAIQALSSRYRAFGAQRTALRAAADAERLPHAAMVDLDVAG
ncbi:MAG: anthrone oxygenase family protein [Acidobacteriota bacterium]